MATASRLPKQNQGKAKHGENQFIECLSLIKLKPRISALSDSSL